MALTAAFAASVAALSVTATQADPFHLFGVFAPFVVSIHKVEALRIDVAGAVPWISTSALPLATPAAAAAAVLAFCAALAASVAD